VRGSEDGLAADTKRHPRGRLLNDGDRSSLVHRNWYQVPDPRGCWGCIFATAPPVRGQRASGVHVVTGVPPTNSP